MFSHQQTSRKEAHMAYPNSGQQYNDNLLSEVSLHSSERTPRLVSSEKKLLAPRKQWSKLLTSPISVPVLGPHPHG